MPVTHHQSLSAQEEAQEHLPPVLDMSLFEQTIDYIDKAKMWQNIEAEDNHKVEKLNKSIDAAQQTIARAEEKLGALRKKNALLKTSLEHMKLRQNQALEYWQNYGLDIKKIPTEQKSCEKYEFIYSKIPNKLHEQASDEDFACSICIQNQENNLQVISHNPSLLNEKQLDELNSKLTDQCIELGGKVNYKSAMILIKKTLIENISRQSQQQINSPPDSKFERS